VNQATRGAAPDAVVNGKQPAPLRFLPYEPTLDRLAPVGPDVGIDVQVALLNQGVRRWVNRNVLRASGTELLTQGGDGRRDLLGRRLVREHGFSTGVVRRPSPAKRLSAFVRG